ncbi:putative UDP-glucuronate:xylan alpha-glucuronosyltransferase 4 [Glycine max]|nr:putative UDP-glucuronate:xylan alpha-glucuronosyltransferase 4 [Glycine max]
MATHHFWSKSIDGLFAYPQSSASPNDFSLFNSGLMVIEPSTCIKLWRMKSYNGGDQALVNEVFTWWHRLPTKLNYLKSFEKREGNENLEVVPEDLYVMHYLVLKPWMCNSLIEIMTVIGT